MGDYASDNNRQHRIASANAKAIGCKVKQKLERRVLLLQEAREIEHEVLRLREDCEHPNRDKVPVDEGGKMSYPWVCLDCGKEL